MSTTRDQIFERAAKRIRAEFEELAALSHNGLKGAEAENLLKRFLTEHIPRRFSVSTGLILDKRDNVSPQTDIVIYDALNCPVYKTFEGAGIFPNDNVAAVIEVKSRLTKKELRDGFEKISAVKKLIKTGPAPNPNGGPSAFQTMGCIVAFTSENSLETTLNEYAQLIQEFKIGPHPDVVAVLDRGMVTLMTAAPGTSEWGLVMSFESAKHAPQGTQLGAGAHELGAFTLDHFLRILLTHLTLFRWIVAHPGFDWHAGPGKGVCQLVPLATL